MTDRLDLLEQRERIRGLVVHSARLLDAEAFDDYVALYAAGAEYAIEVASPEIKKTATWLRADRDELGRLLSESSQHIHDRAARFHHVNVDEVEIDGDTASSRSSFIVVRTDPHGRSGLYADGSYDDAWVRRDEGWLIARRTVLLRTRMLDTPTPMPL